MSKVEPKLYAELASWWPLLSSPESYAEEANIYMRIFSESACIPVKTVLELGSGGGNNACYMKRQFKLTLVDLSEGMLSASRALNPECEHIQGDMRSIRLDRLFDAVFVHDAIMYMTSEEDLGQAVRTAFLHCKPGGAALFVPDFVKETFQSGTSCGGHDGACRAMRYLEWNWDPDPDDTTYICDFAYLLRNEDQSVVVEHDRHELGLFGQAVWNRLLTESGFQAKSVHLAYSDAPAAAGFLGFKPEDI
jgi:SAM-dependent methyltransferase